MIFQTVRYGRSEPARRLLVRSDDHLLIVKEEQEEYRVTGEFIGGAEDLLQLLMAVRIFSEGTDVVTGKFSSVSYDRKVE